MGSGYGSKMAAHFGAARVFSMIVCSHRPERAAFIREHYASAFRTTLPTIPDRWHSRCATATRAGRCARAATFFIFSHDDIEFILPDAVDASPPTLPPSTSSAWPARRKSWTRLIHRGRFVFLSARCLSRWVTLVGGGPLVVSGAQALAVAFSPRHGLHVSSGPCALCARRLP